MFFVCKHIQERMASSEHQHNTRKVGGERQVRAEGMQRMAVWEGHHHSPKAAPCIAGPLQKVPGAWVVRRHLLTRQRRDWCGMD